MNICAQLYSTTLLPTAAVSSVGGCHHRHCNAPPAALKPDVATDRTACCDLRVAVCASRTLSPYSVSRLNAPLKDWSAFSKSHGKASAGSLSSARALVSGMPVSCACPGAPVRPCVLPKSLAACDFRAVRLLCRQQRQRCSPTFRRRACLCSTTTGHSVHSIAIQPQTLQTVDVSLGDRSYPIYIGQGLLSRSDLLQQHILGKKVLVVTNDTVAPLYLERQVPRRVS